MLTKKFNLVVKNRLPSFNKIIKVDSDKSLSIRSFLIGSISNNISSAKNVLESEDVLSTINCLKKLGVKIKKQKKGSYIIYGNGLGSFRLKKNDKLNFGNSGTLARLLTSICATNPGIEAKIGGDQSLNKRSMKKLIELMSRFGATFLPKGKYRFPLKIISSEMPVGINYEAGVSAQLKSAVIFAGLNSFGNTCIREKFSSRDHTENLLINSTKAFKIKKGKEKLITIFGKRSLKPLKLEVGGDPSSAAFFTALTLLNKDSSIKIKNVGLNPTRIGFFKILMKQKAKIKFSNLKKDNNEIKGDISVKSSKLRSLKVPASMYPQTTDEYLLLFLIAALSNGVSTFNGISDLSNKESSRAHEMKKILGQIGVKCHLTKNKMTIFGKGMINAKNKKILIKNLGDHRIAMCGFILALITDANVFIKNFETVFTSSPSFLKIMKFLGAKFEIKK
jgi:3-phosphoshikimate 1-carboxyvinyltransferase